MPRGSRAWGQAGGIHQLPYIVICYSSYKAPPSALSDGLRRMQNQAVRLVYIVQPSPAMPPHRQTYRQTPLFLAHHHPLGFRASHPFMLWLPSSPSRSTASFATGFRGGTGFGGVFGGRDAFRVSSPHPGKAIPPDGAGGPVKDGSPCAPLPLGCGVAGVDRPCHVPVGWRNPEDSNRDESSWTLLDAWRDRGALSVLSASAVGRDSPACEGVRLSVDRADDR